MATNSEEAAGWRNIAMKAYLYLLFMLIIYALFIGFKMSHMLSAGEEVGDFLKSTHVHIILDSFLILFLIYDLRHSALKI